MNVEKLDTIEGQAIIVAMHARRFRSMLVKRGDLPNWDTAAERELEVAAKEVTEALADLLMMQGKIKDARRTAA